MGRPAGNGPVYRATVLVELLILAIYELVFWVKKVDSYAEIAETLCSISQYPLVLFEKKLALFFTYVIPVAFIGTVPTELITGGEAPGPCWRCRCSPQVLWDWSACCGIGGGNGMNRRIKTAI